MDSELWKQMLVSENIPWAIQPNFEGKVKKGEGDWFATLRRILSRGHTWLEWHRSGYIYDKYVMWYYSEEMKVREKQDKGGRQSELRPAVSLGCPLEFRQVKGMVKAVFIFCLFCNNFFHYLLHHAEQSSRRYLDFLSPHYFFNYEKFQTKLELN